MLRDLYSNLKQQAGIVPADYSAAQNGASFDLQGYRSLAILFIVGTLTAGTHTPKLQESDDNAAWTDVAAADQDGTLANLATDTDQMVGYRGNKRYVRAVVTSAGGACIYAATMLAMHAQAKPVN
jgi:hypothetical protein